jgi:hypothetical protein
MQEKGPQSIGIPALPPYGRKGSAIVGSVVPGLVGEVAAEEAPNLLAARVLPVEEAARGEVVGVRAYPKLLAGSEGFVVVVLQIAETVEDVLGRRARKLGHKLRLYFLL